MPGLEDPAAFDASRPNAARVYDYLLGGKDNFGAGTPGVHDHPVLQMAAVGVARKP